jgi:hypothetical protein
MISSSWKNKESASRFYDDTALFDDDVSPVEFRDLTGIQ